MPKPTPTPTVGDTVVYDGESHELTGLREKEVDFTDGTISRTVALAELDAIEPGTWGVRGRVGKRPPRTTVGLEITPHTGEG